MSFLHLMDLLEYELGKRLYTYLSSVSISIGM